MFEFVGYVACNFLRVVFNINAHVCWRKNEFYQVRFRIEFHFNQREGGYFSAFISSNNNRKFFHERNKFFQYTWRIESPVKLGFCAKWCYAFSVVSAFAKLLHERSFFFKQQRIFCVIDQVERSGWNIIRFVKLFLKAFVLNGAKGLWRWKYFLSKTFQFFKCFNVYVFNFDGQNINCFSEIEHSLVVVEISNYKIICKVSAGCVNRRV